MLPKQAPKTSDRPTQAGANPVHASASRDDIALLLAEHRAALLQELKRSFFDEVNRKLDDLQTTSDSHGQRLGSLEDNAETLHQRLT